MKQLVFLPFKNAVSVVFILFSLWRGRISATLLCRNGLEMTYQTNLNMDSSPISGSFGMCSCRIQLNDNGRLSMYADINISDCSTSLSLSDSAYEYKCDNGRIKEPLSSYSRYKNAGEELWLFVSSTNISTSMSGHLQIKHSGLNFTLECFDENTNSSLTTPIQTKTRKTQAMTTTTTTETTRVFTTRYKEGPSTMRTAKANLPSTKFSSDGSPSFIKTTLASSSRSDDKRDKEKNLLVAAVAGGVAGGMLLILVVILGIICFRRRNREQNLLENGGQSSTDQGNDNRAFESDGPTLGEMKPQDMQSADNTKHVHVENDLYVSADSDHQPHHSQVNLTDSVPGHYASPGDLSIDKSDVESVEGSEIVITSSGDLYAVVDESKKNQHATDTNPTASLADLYAVVDPTMKHQDELLFDPNPTQDGGYAMVNKKQDPHDIDSTSMVSPSGDVYAVVNKKQDPQDIDPTSMVSPSGDVYAVVNKKQDPQDIDPTSVVSPSGDVYAVVNKKQDPQDIDPTSVVPPSGDVNKNQDPQDFDTTHTFSSFGDIDKKRDSQVLDPNHVTSPSGNVYAVVEKKQEADQNDLMARTATDDEEEEAIRRVMDMNDERPSSDTLQSTSL